MVLKQLTANFSCIAPQRWSNSNQSSYKQASDGRCALVSLHKTTYGLWHQAARTAEDLNLCQRNHMTRTLTR
eukprot:5788856-Amphidinium_carterae.1